MEVFVVVEYFCPGSVYTYIHINRVLILRIIPILSNVLHTQSLSNQNVCRQTDSAAPGSDSKEYECKYRNTSGNTHFRAFQV